MRVATLVCGVLGLVMALVFLGNYAIRINSVPLWVIIVGVLLLPCADLLVALRDEANSPKENGEPES